MNNMNDFKIIKKPYIMAQDLDIEQRNLFIEKFKNKENVYILTNGKNIEYKITNFKHNIFNLEFTGVVYE